MLAYPAKVEPDGDGFLVTFRDIPEAITGGDAIVEALEEAIDCLDVALAGFYADSDRDLPAASAPRRGEYMVSPSLPYALKLSLYQAMREEGVRPAELARRLGVDHKTVSGRLLKLTYRVNVELMTRAFKVIGRTPFVQTQKSLEPTPKRRAA